jgi:hypothetical protein
VVKIFLEKFLALLLFFSIEPRRTRRVYPSNSILRVLRVLRGQIIPVFVHSAHERLPKVEQFEEVIGLMRELVREADANHQPPIRKPCAGTVPQK